MSGAGGGILKNGRGGGEGAGKRQKVLKIRPSILTKNALAKCDTIFNDIVNNTV